MADDWPWDQAPDFGVITLKSIVFEDGPILHVTHDLEDHGWQFLGWDTPMKEDAALVCLSHIDALDLTVREIAHMPPGWHAWRRSKEEPWTIEPYPEERDVDETEQFH